MTYIFQFVKCEDLFYEKNIAIQYKQNNNLHNSTPEH